MLMRWRDDFQEKNNFSATKNFFSSIDFTAEPFVLFFLDIVVCHDIPRFLTKADGKHVEHCAAISVAGWQITVPIIRYRSQVLEWGEKNQINFNTQRASRVIWKEREKKLDKLPGQLSGREAARELLNEDCHIYITCGLWMEKSACFSYYSWVVGKGSRTTWRAAAAAKMCRKTTTETSGEVKGAILCQNIE